ncbi:histidinol-phosphate transaminase [Candidatus Poribacteria bacterium]|nr:histidinol-phosphate transaminase [Candidatus Poribacteria bacterium]
MTGPRPRAAIAAMHGYTPGEQPKVPGLIKLNTNENPYPPSPQVLEVLCTLRPDAARKYPPPDCDALRAAIAGDLEVEPAQVLVTNGSDEILRMAVEAYVEPRERVGYLWPTYSLYPVFVAKLGALEVRLEWSPAGHSQEAALEAAPNDLKVLFVTNPNPPVGLAVGMGAIAGIARRLNGTLVVVDEAYIAYGGETAMALVRAGMPNLLVTRTFSKSHSLAGMRVGFGVGSREVIELLHRIKDSYNVSAANQGAALAAWSDRDYTANVVRRIRETRNRLTGELRRFGFGVEESAGNFVFARRSDAPEVFRHLRSRNILVRYFDTPELRDGLRITVGTEVEVDALLATLRQVSPPPGGQ